MEKDKERLAVIENIKRAVSNETFNVKVENDDPVVTDEQREDIVLNYDIFYHSLSKKIKRILARRIVNNYTNFFNGDTEIVGIDKLRDIKGGAIITCNHFNVMDSTIIRKLMMDLKKEKKLAIVIEESNIFLPGKFNLLTNNCNTIPLSSSRLYMKNKFYPAMEKRLNDGDWILIYPEEEMWFNYKKPRPLKPGAYHFAIKYNVPIISCFIEMREKDEYDDNGFRKIKFILHIMGVINPEENSSNRELKEKLMNEDYKLKVKAFEEAYGKKLNYDFDSWDIAGLD